MRILVTGGAGFIGSHLDDALLADGHQVVAVDNLSLGRIRNIHHLSAHPRFQFAKADVTDRSSLNAIFSEGFDAVFHLAANSDIARSHAEPEVDLQHTFESTHQILAAMRKYRVRKLVFASTSAIYGELSGQLREDSGPLQPVSHYGAGKLASEAFISSYAHNYGIECSIVRFPNVVGGRATHGVIYDFIQKLRRNPKQLDVLGDGQQCKPYLYVKDLVGAILRIWAAAKSPVNVFNVGVDSRTTVSQIAEMVVEAMGGKAEIQYSGGSRGWIGDVPTFQYALDKIHTLGWRAEKTSDQAVACAIREILEDEDEGCHFGRGQGDTTGPDRRTEAHGPSLWENAA